MTKSTDHSADATSCAAAAPSEDGLSRRDLLKVGALGILGGIEGLAIAGNAAATEAPKQAGPIPLLFDEPTDRPAGSVTWPVTVGVPFANGVLPSTDPLALTAGEMPVPAQFTKAIDWRYGEKTISWAHCDFQTSLGHDAKPGVALHAAGRENPTPEKSVTVADSGTHFTIDTGAVSFTCSKTAFNLFDSFVADNTPLVRSSSLYWKDTQNQTYEAKHAVTDAVVEKSGPLRAVIRYDGWYGTDAETRKLRYSVWLHAFAGLPYVRIYNKLIWTEDLTLYVVVDPQTNELTTRSLYADRRESPSFVAHGWSSGMPVKWKYSHSDHTPKGANQYFDNTSPAGNAMVVLPKVVGEQLERDTTYYVRAKNETTLTLHRTQADALAGEAAIKFIDQGVFTDDEGVQYVGRHYLQAQQPVLAEWGLRVTFAKPVTHAAVDVSGAAHPASYDLGVAKSVTATQTAHRAATLALGEGKQTHVHELAGWAEARGADGTGLAVAVKGLSHQIPKELHLDAETLTIKLWGGTPMSLAEEDRVLPVHREQGYPKEWLAFTGEANPLGISKTHEIWLWPAQSVAQNRLINDLVQRPVACCPEPRYACATDYLGGLRARSETPAAYDSVETALENMLRHLTARDTAHGDYDEWNFGDLRLFRNGPFRTWDNGGYNCSDLFWWQWFRTGKRFFLEEGINNARHVMDVDTIAHSQTVVGESDTYVRIAGRTHNYSTFHWASPIAYGDLFDDHPAYLLTCWLMTGYEVARTVLETKCAERQRANYGNPGPLTKYDLEAVTREQYGAARPKFVYYEFTGDEKFYAAGRGWLELAMKAQAVSQETNGLGTRLFPNNNFWGFFYEAFLQAYRYSGEKSLLEALGKTVDDFAVTPTSYLDAPYFKATWPAPSRLGRHRNSLLTFVAAFQATRDPRYLQYPLDRIQRQCRTIQSSGLLLGYDEIEGIMAPVFLRDALVLIGTIVDAGAPAPWMGNSPMFGSRPVAAGVWKSRLTMWAKKKARQACRIRLIFKDTNLTPLESPGRVRVVILDPAGATNSMMLTKDVSYAAEAADTMLVLAKDTVLTMGQPVRFTTSGKLPPTLAADTTYYIHVAATRPDVRVSVHRSYEEAVQGTNPLVLDGGRGPLTLLAAPTLSGATFTLPDRGPAGAYRIHLEAEAAVFRVFPAADSLGFVVELPGLGELPIDGTLGPVEYHVRLRKGESALRLSTKKDKSHLVQPVAVLDTRRNRLGSFDYDGGKTTTAEIKIPAPATREVLKLAKGMEEYSPRAADDLPQLRLGGAERYVSMIPAQWFSPLQALTDKLAAFWTLEEADGVRRDATGQGRDLTPNHGAIETDHGGPLGSAAKFAPPANAWLASENQIFRADGSFTVWGWVRLDEVAEARYLFVKGGDVHDNPASCEWAIYVQPTPSPRVFLQARVGKKYVFTPGLPLSTDGRVHFVIGWYSATARTIMLQVDNGKIATQTLTGAINVGTQPFGVGGSAANGRGWLGTIAAVGFAKTALSATERTLLFNGGGGLQYPF